MAATEAASVIRIMRTLGYSENEIITALAHVNDGEGNNATEQSRLLFSERNTDDLIEKYSNLAKCAYRAW